MYDPAVIVKKIILKKKMSSWESENHVLPLNDEIPDLIEALLI